MGIQLVSGINVEISVGNALPIHKNIPVGTIVHNIELKPKEPVLSLSRAAGTSAQITAKRKCTYAQLKLSSGETKPDSHRTVMATSW